jgi:hypothetical protein
MRRQKQKKGPRIHKKLIGKDKKLRAEVYKTFWEMRAQKKAIKQN